jgi:parvulin-like peptidyl-prolyl isomerase
MFPLRSLLVVAVCALSLSSTFAQTSRNGVAAVVNGKVITKSEVADAVNAQRQMIIMQNRDNPMRAQRELAEVESKALDQLIERELVLTEFKTVGGTIKPQYVDDDINTLIREQFKGDREAFVVELAKSGMTLKKFRELREKMIIVQIMRSKHGGNQAPPTPRQVEEYYSSHQDIWRDKDMLKISTITIPKFSGDANATPEKQKALAQEVRSKIVAGADFATMAKTYSQDSRAENGGEWDWMERKLMKPTMADAAFALKDGGVSQVIEDEAAFIILYLDAKKLGSVTPLEKVRDDIEKMLRSESAKGDIEKWMETLKKKAIIRKMQ